jgi:hypothetical protein
MNDWSLGALTSAAHEHASANLQRWSEHAAFFDDTVGRMLEARWIHPWMNFAADVMRSGREFKALVLPAHVAHLASSTGFPHGEPGSDAEAHSYCLHLMTGAVLRSLARSGFLAFAGLPIEAIGVHRRTVESLLQIELLVDDPALAIHCWRLTQTYDKGRRKNLFYMRAKAASSVVNNPQQDPASLSPLQRELHRSANDSGLNLGPHAGLQHGFLGKGKGLPFEAFHPFDVGSDVGTYAWRCAAQTLKLVTALLPKLHWVDQPKWRAAIADLEPRSAVIETRDRARRGTSQPAEMDDA